MVNEDETGVQSLYYNRLLCVRWPSFILVQQIIFLNFRKHIKFAQPKKYVFKAILILSKPAMVGNTIKGKANRGISSEHTTE